MVRRLLTLVAGLLLASILLIGTASAQQSPGPTVLPDSPTTQPAPQVAGVQVTRPLPRTGSDLGGAAILGGALTITGVALAMGARHRRNSFEHGRVEV